MNKVFYFLLCLSIATSCKKNTPATPTEQSIKIESVYPGTTKFGDTVTIRGINFPENPAVRFRETSAIVISSSPTEIKTIMPQTATGILRIVVSSATKASNYFNINVVSPIKEITVQGANYIVDTISNFTAGPGIRYLALNFSNAASPLRVFMLEMERSNQYLNFKPVLSFDSTTQRENLSKMSERKSKPGENYLAGINGDFFDIPAGSPEIGRPYQGTIIDEIVGTMPTNPAEYYLIFDAAKKMYVDKLTYSGNVTTSASSSFNIADVNDSRKTNELIIYNKYHGKITKTSTTGSEVVVVPVSGNAWGLNKNISLRVSQTNFDAGNSLIPEEGAVLSGDGSASTFLKTLNVGDVVTVKLNLVPTENTGIGIRQVIGAHNFMLKGGSFLSDNWNERHPRTGVGFSADGNKLYYIVIDGRSQFSAGATTFEMADILKQSGAAYAINFDGGGSSAMYLKNVGIMNNPSDGSPRAVGNAMFTTSSAPEDANITSIAADKYSMRLSKGESFSIKALGMNQYGTIINSDLSNVTITCPPDLGTIVGNTFKATSTKSIGGSITVSYNNLKTYIKVLVF